MTELRKDGEPWVKDKQGKIPHYVIENNEEGLAILINQLSCESGVIGERPIQHEDPRLLEAHKRLISKERNAK